jgi:hypothetical protein
MRRGRVAHTPQHDIPNRRKHLHFAAKILFRGSNNHGGCLFAAVPLWDSKFTTDREHPSRFGNCISAGIAELFQESVGAAPLENRAPAAPCSLPR